MPDNHPLEVTPAFGRDLKEVVAQHRDRPRTQDAGEHGSAQPRHPKVVCLLEDLSAGGTAQAEILRREDRYVVLDVAAIGEIDRLRFERFSLIHLGSGNATELIPFDSSADEVESALRTIPEVDAVLRSVTLGTNGIPRWRIALDLDATPVRNPNTGELYFGIDSPAFFEDEESGEDQVRHVDMLIQVIPWTGTGGTITVHAPLSLPWPHETLPLPFDVQSHSLTQPLRRGRCGIAIPRSRGWLLSSAESLPRFPRPTEETTGVPGGEGDGASGGRVCCGCVDAPPPGKWDVWLGPLGLALLAETTSGTFISDVLELEVGEEETIEYRATLTLGEGIGGSSLIVEPIGGLAYDCDEHNFRWEYRNIRWWLPTCANRFALYDWCGRPPDCEACIVPRYPTVRVPCTGLYVEETLAQVYHVTIDGVTSDRTRTYGGPVFDFMQTPADQTQELPYADRSGVNGVHEIAVPGAGGETIASSLASVWSGSLQVSAHGEHPAAHAYRVSLSFMPCARREIWYGILTVRVSLLNDTGEVIHWGNFLPSTGTGFGHRPRKADGSYDWIARYGVAELPQAPTNALQPVVAHRLDSSHGARWLTINWNEDIRFHFPETLLLTPILEEPDAPPAD